MKTTILETILYIIGYIILSPIVILKLIGTLIILLNEWCNHKIGNTFIKQSLKRLKYDK